jgi:sulfate transport system substrate-binding protein
MSYVKTRTLALFLALGAVMLAGPAGQAQAKDLTLLNVSYDPTRELYRALDADFAKAYQAKTGDKITIRQSHGGSGSQARKIIDGLDADVATLALASDIDAIADHGLLPENWQQRLPDNSSPYTSTIVFLVRKGNPKHIKDWDDLVKGDVQVITPNPKTSGGARWNFLAAWAYELNKSGGNVDKAQQFVKQLYQHVPVLDSGARGSTTTFVERGEGDVLLAWENEAFLALKELGPGKFDIVVPSLSILAEPPVAVVDKVVDRKGTRAAAQAYLEYLYTPHAQDIIARSGYRPIDKNVAAKYASSFPKLKLVTIDDPIFGGWRAAQKKYFGDGGIFDQIYQPKK